MACLKDIHVEIAVAGEPSKVLFTGVAANSLDFPPEFVGKIMTAVTGHKLESDDHDYLNHLHCHGKCAFRFGPDWEFYVTASVKYPE
jgi:hypothetical protein